MSDKPVTGTQSIDRACDLLMRIMNADGPITLTELVSQTKLAKGTTSRILSALERSALIGRSPYGGFEPGSELNKFAIRGGAYAAIIEAFTPAMEQIAKATGETVNLGVGSPHGLESIAQVDSSYLLGSHDWVGKMVPLHASASGKVLLANGAYPMPSELTPVTSETITDFEQFEIELRKVRERGYATIRNELERGLVAIAVPVFSHTGKVIAAISITGPAERIIETDEMRTAQLMQIAVKMSHKPEHEGAA
ncbi:MAG: IclR family transcriptional regulator [Actinomycetes bacterium]